MTLLDSVRDFCSQHGLTRTYWVAFSGGLDSHVLLSLCADLRAELSVKLRAIHVNHQISPQAAEWAAHCAQICNELNIDFTSVAISLDLQPGDSFEEAAREKRYAALADFLQEGDVLLTAHHQDDQAETFLLQLMRGAGLKGLAAMPMIKPFANGYHGRPLLTHARSYLAEYAKQHSLRHIHDESNADTALSRNFLRHHVMPLLKQRWPAASSTIARSAAHCAEAQTLLAVFAQSEWQVVQGSQPGTLSVTKLLQQDDTRQRLLLRHWIQTSGYALPDAKKLRSIQRDVLQAAWDRQPCVTWGGTAVRRHRDDLFLLPLIQPAEAAPSFAWDLSSPLSLPDGQILQAEQSRHGQLHAAIQQVEVRFRQGGEVVYVAGRGRRKLKQLFQEWGVPTWRRDRIPLLYLNEKLIAVLGYFIDASVLAPAEESGWHITMGSVD